MTGYATVRGAQERLANRDYSAIAGCRKRRVRNCAGNSGDLLPPSPPAEKAAAARMRPGSPAPTMGPGTVETVGAPIAVMEKSILEMAKPPAWDVRKKWNCVLAKTLACASPTRSTMSPNRGLRMVNTMLVASFCPLVTVLVQPRQLTPFDRLCNPLTLVSSAKLMCELYQAAEWLTL